MHVREGQCCQIRQVCKIWPLFFQLLREKGRGEENAALLMRTHSLGGKNMLAFAFRRLATSGNTGKMVWKLQGRRGKKGERKSFE